MKDVVCDTKPLSSVLTSKESKIKFEKIDFELYLTSRTEYISPNLFLKKLGRNSEKIINYWGSVS